MGTNIGLPKKQNKHKLVIVTVPIQIWIEDVDPTETDQIRALDYMGLEPGMKMIDIEIDLKIYDSG